MSQIDTSEDIARKLDEMNKRMQTMETFFARRFDEVSMEINATFQQVEMIEESTIRRFAEIFDTLRSLTFTGDGSSPANTGVELNAVVDMTENAANTILDAAERISTKLREETKNWDHEDQEQREKGLAAIYDEIEAIFMACSFQDITAQRIKKTLENIHSIEDRLGNVMTKMGVNLDDLKSDLNVGKVSSQEEIDVIFAQRQENEDDKKSDSKGSGTISQEDIDSMFD